MSRQSYRVGASKGKQSCMEAYWTKLADQWHQGKRISQDDLQRRAIAPRLPEDHYHLLEDPNLYAHLHYLP